MSTSMKAGTQMLLNSLISTHKALINKMTTKPRIESFPKTINPKYTNYENRIMVINISTEHYSVV